MDGILLKQLFAKKNEVQYFNCKNLTSAYDFGDLLLDYIITKRKEDQPLVFMCIGTDRATGDCLGPLVGYKLLNSSLNQFTVLGSLSSPIHALNLNTVIKEVYNVFENPFIVAIDACLGRKEHIGYVTLSSRGLTPGEGVCKSLPLVGDLSITGIVNESHHSGSLLLQNTRLNVVMDLADYIYTGVHHAISQA